ncbi:MAG: hypothetical protein A3F74_00695 [Betaproteobacteria bacterium RIFCSPLOWO2_12_FULL_62_58]|nr:MAG: hypothetical protein A3F74_00695 [Betaproteobacteria bacterium RIFCSPLOWO2_12_FULL_62_58]
MYGTCVICVPVSAQSSSAPRLPPAPGRLSTMKGCPHTALKCWPMSRARLSTPPPALTGTMTRTGRAG